MSCCGCILLAIGRGGRLRNLPRAPQRSRAADAVLDGLSLGAGIWRARRRRRTLGRWWWWKRWNKVDYFADAPSPDPEVQLAWARLVSAQVFPGLQHQITEPERVHALC